MFTQAAFAEERFAEEQSEIPTTKAFLRPHQFLAYENEKQAAIYLILEGWACRYRLFSDGRRQVTGLFLPGDYCELEWAQRGTALQSIVALTNVRALSMQCEDILRAADEDEAFRKRLWSHILASSYQQVEWITSLGRKNALERLSHLFCEIFQRLRRRGLTYGDQCAMPLTQIDLADIAGITPVHVNRILQEMRSKGLVELQSKWLRIPDLDELSRVALL